MVLRNSTTVSGLLTVIEGHTRILTKNYFFKPSMLRMTFRIINFSWHHSCQFLVRDDEDYSKHATDPDLLVDWDCIEQVVSVLNVSVLFYHGFCANYQPFRFQF